MRSLLIASTMAMLATSAGPAGAEPFLAPVDADRIRPVIPAAIEFFNERCEDPLPALTSDQVAELLEGEVVRIRRRPDRDAEDPPERVTGYRLIRQPRAQVWVAALDPTFQASGLLSEARLGRNDDGTSLWHQYLSLPWPVTDRHWVIRVGTRTELAARTDDLIWEQFWELAPGGQDTARVSIARGDLEGITPESSKDAIYVPANEGSWILFRLEEDLTLVAYRIITRVGGSIPDSWIATFGMAQLSGVLDEVARHAGEVPAIYDPEVHPSIGGNGEPVPRF
jgi:hypothetical protein